MSMCRWWTVAVVLALGAACGGLTAGEQPPDDIKSAKSFIRDGKLDLDAAVEYFEDLYRSDSSISVAELTVVRPRNTRTLRMKSWTRGEEKALVVIQSPPREEGTATLKVEKNLWNYFPRIRRTIRIPPSMMQAAWMGSDFTNDDLVRESSYSEDYTYELVGQSKDPEGWLIRFTAKPDVVGLWNSLELIVSQDGTIPLKARYYDRKDRLARVMLWDEVKVFDDRRIPAHMTLVPVDKNKDWAEKHEDKTLPEERTEYPYRTEMMYYDIDFDVNVPESTFSLSRLEQKR